MSGIVRIKITGQHTMGRRMELCEKMQPAADKIYNDLFILEEGVSTITGTKDDVIGRADWQEGIDLILHDKSGAKLATVQEKFMEFQGFRTVTFEEFKESGRNGAWYTCSAQLYFVGYTLSVLDDFYLWIIIDLVKFRIANNAGRIKWQENRNKKEGRTNIFRYVFFGDIPEDCIIAKHVPVDEMPF